jgi:hypothetical protein
MKPEDIHYYVHTGPCPLLVDFSAYPAAFIFKAYFNIIPKHMTFYLSGDVLLPVFWLQ